MLICGQAGRLMFQHACHGGVSICTGLGWGPNTKAPVAAPSSPFSGERRPIVFRFWWGYRLVRSTRLGRGHGFVIARSANKHVRGYSDYATGNCNQHIDKPHTTKLSTYYTQVKSCDVFMLTRTNGKQNWQSGTKADCKCSLKWSYIFLHKQLLGPPCVEAG
jgi:hypothetical protein